MPKIDFLRKMIDKHCDIIIRSDSVEKYFDISKIEIIELITRGQSSNEACYLYRKGVITGSKGHEVRTKMKKVKKGEG